MSEIMDSKTLKELYETFLLHPHISTDSRKIEPGSLFFALHGEHFDGNQFAATALDNGAILAVVDNPKVIPIIDPEPCSCGHHHHDHALYDEEDEQESYICDSHDDTHNDDEDKPKRDPRYILVPDTLKALQALAAYHRHELGVMILAITGSNGKTTTKELIGRTLSQKYATTVTQGNLNNHIGVPLTLLSMTADTDFAVVEMGASHQHEIELLCKIAQPDFGLITNIGRAHLEGFGGAEGIRKGKGELLDYLAANGGTAFYLRDDQTLEGMVNERPDLFAVPYSATQLERDNNGEFIGVRWKGQTIHSHLVGDYNLNNIAAALAMASYFAVAPEDAAEAISSYIPDNNRSQKQVTAHNTLIKDAYNANPSSMQAALENFATSSSDLPKVVILGDMAELGSYSAEEHEQIVTLLQRLNITEAYLVGEHFSAVLAQHAITSGNSEKTATATPESIKTNNADNAHKGSSATSVSDHTSPVFSHFADVEALYSHLESHPLRNRFILIKGSRSMHLEKLFDLL